MFSPIIIQQESHNAELARQAGNEGKARVCARRAAGWAIARWRQTQLSTCCETANAMQQLLWGLQSEALPEPVRAACHTLSLRVEPDHTLASPQDPLVAAAIILEFCLTTDS